MLPKTISRVWQVATSMRMTTTTVAAYNERRSLMSQLGSIRAVSTLFIVALVTAVGAMPPAVRAATPVKYVWVAEDVTSPACIWNGVPCLKGSAEFISMRRITADLALGQNLPSLDGAADAEQQRLFVL